MHKRSGKPGDLNSLDAAIVGQASIPRIRATTLRGKNPAAVELGRLGGIAELLD